MENKLLTLLGFAAKAGKLSFGMNTSVMSLKSGKSALVVAAADVSEKSRKEITFHSDKYGVGVITLESDIKTVSKAVGRSCGILSVNDGQFATAILNAVGNTKGGIANDKQI